MFHVFFLKLALKKIPRTREFLSYLRFLSEEVEERRIGWQHGGIGRSHQIILLWPTASWDDTQRLSLILVCILKKSFHCFRKID